MAFSRLVFTVLFLSVSCYGNNVPAFLWGDHVTTINSNPLEKTSTDDFASIFKNAVSDDALTVVFIEPTLSAEDISSKNANHETPYRYLEKQLKSGHIYLSAVDSPVQAIEESADPSEVEHVALTEDGLSRDLSSDAKFLLINLKDAKEGESRAELLSRHNDFIQKTFDELKKSNDNVVGVYTANYPSWVITESHSRVRRQATSNETDDYILDGVRLYVERVELREGDNVLNLTNTPTSSMTVNDTLHTMNTTVNFGDRSFILNFRTKMGYWFLDSVTFNLGAVNEETLYPTREDLFALTGFSYRCGQKTTFNNINTNSSRSLTFINLQVQPFFTSINSSVQFGDSFDCVGFFSGPIWAGLMITFILLAITFYGIMMMMDIKTMDRFDDPKGKTITINASE